MVDIHLELVEIDDSFETENSSKNLRDEMRFHHSSLSTLAGSVANQNQSAQSENSRDTNFSSFAGNPVGSFWPPLYADGQGASLPNAATGISKTAVKQQQQQWTLFANFSAPSPYFGGFYNHYGQFSDQTQQLSQIQQVIKSLEDHLLVQTSGSTTNMSTETKDTPEGNKSLTTKSHDISDNETLLSDVLSAEGNFVFESDKENVNSASKQFSFKDLVNKVSETGKSEEKKGGKPSSSKLDRLYKLSQDSESEESFSEKVNEKLEKTVNSGMQALFSNTASKDLINKYNTPENCE